MRKSLPSLGVGYEREGVGGDNGNDDEADGRRVDELDLAGVGRPL